MENVYIALIINQNNYPNFSQYNRVINLFNQKYPNNTFVIDKYLTNGTNLETDSILDDFIGNILLENVLLFLLQQLF